MKEYTLIYVPFGRYDKEWMHIHADSDAKALEEAKEYGDIINLTENK